MVAIKIAPFNRYQTLDVLRAVADSDRSDIALYTGNDDQIVLDLLTPFPALGASERAPRIVGGLLGPVGGVDTSRSGDARRDPRVPQCSDDRRRMAHACGVAHGRQRRALRRAPRLRRLHSPGLHEILRRQRLLAGIWCLDPNEGLSPGQLEEIDRVIRAHPELSDDEFVAANIDAWLR